jgi:hypothetical protein
MVVLQRNDDRGLAMPSAALLYWRNDRQPRLTQIDTQCATSLALVPPNPHLIDENLRGFVVLLSAHFQGFCRELYLEASQIVVSRARPSLQPLFQRQFTSHLKLDHGNPNLSNIRGDFERFGFLFDLVAVDPANAARLQNLSELNRWRNIAAHHATIPPGAPLSLADLQTWRISCDGLATSLDARMYNVLRRILRRAPWIP